MAEAHRRVVDFLSDFRARGLAAGVDVTVLAHHEQAWPRVPHLLQQDFGGRRGHACS
jgi:hypothetical protein